MPRPSKDIYVDCDSDCKALRVPRTLPEHRDALAHWKDHDLDAGCSHGC